MVEKNVETQWKCGAFCLFHDFDDLMIVSSVPHDLFANCTLSHFALIIAATFPPQPRVKKRGFFLNEYFEF